MRKSGYNLEWGSKPLCKPAYIPKTSASYAAQAHRCWLTRPALTWRHLTPPCGKMCWTPPAWQTTLHFEGSQGLLWGPMTARGCEISAWQPTSLTHLPSRINGDDTHPPKARILADNLAHLGRFDLKKLGGSRQQHDDQQYECRGRAVEA